MPGCQATSTARFLEECCELQRPSTKQDDHDGLPSRRDRIEQLLLSPGQGQAGT
jgi:hypothetical protein